MSLNRFSLFLTMCWWNSSSPLYVLQGVTQIGRLPSFYPAETLCSDSTWKLEVYLVNPRIREHRELTTPLLLFVLTVVSPDVSQNPLLTLRHWTPSEMLLQTLRAAEYEMRIWPTDSVQHSPGAFTARLVLATLFFKN